MKRILVLCLAGVVLLTGLSGAASATTNYDKAIDIAREQANNAISNGASSASIAIMDGDNVVYAEAFGLTDRDSNIPANTATQYNIGSVSKIFTAAAILLLCEDGKVDLDKPVTDYLPQFKLADPRYRQISVRMLLNHSSGMPGTNYKDMDDSVRNSGYVNQTLAVLANSGLKANPGDVSVYCNDGFTVAQAIVEKMSGMSYAAFVNKRIVGMSDMNNSSCYFRQDSNNIAVSFAGNEGRVLPVEYVNALGANGLASTPVDLCRFAHAIWTGKTLSEKSLAEYSRPQYGPDTVPPLVGAKITGGFGLGWDSVARQEYIDRGITVLSVASKTVQFNSQLLTAPLEWLTVAVTVCGSADSGAICQQLLQTLLDAKGIKHAPLSDASEPKLVAVAIPKSAYGYEGIYVSDGLALRRSFTDDNTIVRNYNLSYGYNQMQYPDKYLSDGYMHYGLTRFGFGENMYGKFTIFIDQNNSPVYVSKKIESGAKVFDAAPFDNRLWLQRNLSCSDFVCNPLIRTKALKKLPGYMRFGDEIVWLTSETSATNAMPYWRDTVELSLSRDKGQDWLKQYANLYTDAKIVAILQPQETIIIGRAGYSEWRLADKETVFDGIIPARSRVIVAAADGRIVFDGLTNTVKPLTVTAGSYVNFIGNPGTRFVLGQSQER
ncbi:MAG: serine hydrolase domain-containing protein [Bacillota bacterium]